MYKNQYAGRTEKSIGGKYPETRQKIEACILNDGNFPRLDSASLNINTNEQALDIITTAVQNRLDADIQRRVERKLDYILLQYQPEPLNRHIHKEMNAILSVVG
ncbi:MAG: hypothetical protein PVF83_11810 [Anaerolineales bacterium]|jgi:hypothetical protein